MSYSTNGAFQPRNRKKSKWVDRLINRPVIITLKNNVIIEGILVTSLSVPPEYLSPRCSTVYYVQTINGDYVELQKTHIKKIIPDIKKEIKNG